MPDRDLAAIEAVVFDAYGTLFDVFSVADGVRAAVGTDGDRADRVIELWRRKQLEYSWLRSLMRDHVDFWRVTRDALDFALDTVGAQDPALSERLMELYLQLTPYPEVPGVLTTLRDNGVPRAVLSNGAPAMLQAAVGNAQLDALLDAVLSVEDVGVYKPSASVYQLAVDRLTVQADRICFLSSNAWDVAGAAHFGLRVIWVNRFGQASERLPGRPVEVVESLETLPALLGLAARPPIDGTADQTTDHTDGSPP